MDDVHIHSLGGEEIKSNQQDCNLNELVYIVFLFSFVLEKGWAKAQAKIYV